MSLIPDNPDEIGEDLAWLEELLADAESTTRLSEWEESFMDDLRGRVAQYGVRTRVSAKQTEVLHRIEAKLYGT